MATIILNSSDIRKAKSSLNSVKSMINTQTTELESVCSIVESNWTGKDAVEFCKIARSIKARMRNNAEQIKNISGNLANIESEAQQEETRLAQQMAQK